MSFVLSSLPSGVANSPPRTALPAGSSRRGLFSFLPAAVSGEKAGKISSWRHRKSWRGSFRQVGWAAPGEAGQSRSGRCPQQGGFGDWGGVCCCFQHFYGTRLDCNTSAQLSPILSRLAHL